jgi:hypothetical protein
MLERDHGTCTMVACPLLGQSKSQSSKFVDLNFFDFFVRPEYMVRCTHPSDPKQTT